MDFLPLAIWMVGWPMASAKIAEVILSYEKQNMGGYALTCGVLYIAWMIYFYFAAINP